MHAEFKKESFTLRTQTTTEFQPKGIVVPLLTPFNEDGALDPQALRHLTRRLIAAGVHGLFPSGSTGEFFALSHQERCDVIDIVIDEAGGRVPIYAGTGAISTRESIELTKTAETLGADAMAVITPFYISPTQEELYAHYAAIAASTSLPVVIYNNPARTGGVSLAAATLVRLAAIANIVGIKDSSGDLGLMASYITETPDDLVVFQGRDDLYFPSFALGAVGGIAATGNVMPELVVEIYSAFQLGDWIRSREAQAKVSLLRAALGISTFPSVLKGTMTLIGESVGPPRLPVAPLSGTQIGTVRGVLGRIGLPVVAESTN